MENDVFTVTYVSFAFLKVYEAGKILNMRSRPTAGLTLVLSGRLSLTYDDGRTVTAGENDIILQRRGDSYLLEAVGETDARYIVISYTAEPEERLDRILPKRIFRPGYAGRFRDAFLRAVDVFSSLGICRDTLLRTLVQEILCNVIRSDRRASIGRLRDPALVARSYIDENFEAKIGTADIAHAAGCSESHLRSLFKSNYGVSMVEYLNSVRVERAKKMLESGVFSLDEIAAACGFANVYYFSTVFKKHAGISPGKY